MTDPPTGYEIDPRDYEVPTRDELRQMREQFNLTQATVAEAIDVSHVTVRGLENGDKDTRISTYFRLVAFYQALADRWEI